MDTIRSVSNRLGMQRVCQVYHPQEYQYETHRFITTGCTLGPYPQGLYLGAFGQGITLSDMLTEIIYG